MYYFHIQGTRVCEDEGSRALQKPVNIYLTAQHHIPKDNNLHKLRVFENWMLRRISGQMSQFVLLPNYYQEMGRLCSTHERDKAYIQNFIQKT
jgi:hypothetical protein